jgi:hypothetical protein
MKTVVGIDPGANGGIAVGIEGVEILVYNMPETRAHLIALIKDIIVMAGGAYRMIVYYESPSNFIPGASPASMCEYGRKLERPVCVFEALNVDTVELPPKKWQKIFDLGVSERIIVRKYFSQDERRFAKKYNAEAKRNWKRKLCEKAKQLFPKLKVTLKNCDALLILSYGIQMELEEHREPFLL